MPRTVMSDSFSSMSARRKARKRALDVLYQADIRDEPADVVLADYVRRLAEPHPEQLAYTVQLVDGVETHRERIDEVISTYAEGWTLDRMPVVDRIALDKAIAQLPPGYRTVFILHDIEGHEHEEIAKLLGCSVGTSKSQLHKARMKLRGLLKRRRLR